MIIHKHILKVSNSPIDTLSKVRELPQRSIGKKKFLISLLTSGKIKFLKAAYKSIMRQLNTIIDYDIIIIVNTLNDNYYKEVLENIQNCKIIRTESNGSPGKGHNSVLQYFREHSEYDYIITLDGDDFLYPYALHKLEKYIQQPYDPDILLLPFSDVLTLNYHPNQLSYPIDNKCYLHYNIKDLNLLNSVYAKSNPFTNNIADINTAGRIILLSRKALDMNLKYDENLKWFDDLYPFLQILEYNTISTYYNIYYMCIYDFYLYNSINNTSASASFNLDKINNYITEDKLFKESIKHKFLSIKDWNLKSIKVLENDYNINDFNIIDKIKWCKQLIRPFDLSNININYNNFNKLNLFAQQTNIPIIYDKHNII